MIHYAISLVRLLKDAFLSPSRDCTLRLPPAIAVLLSAGFATTIAVGAVPAAVAAALLTAAARAPRSSPIAHAARSAWLFAVMAFLLVITGLGSYELVSPQGASSGPLLKIILTLSALVIAIQLGWAALRMITARPMPSEPDS